MSKWVLCELCILLWYGAPYRLMLGLHRIKTNLGPIYELQNYGFLNWPSNKSDLRPHRDRLASARDPCKPFIGLSALTRAPKLQPRPTGMIDVPPNSDLHVILCDRLATDLRPTWARPPRVTCVTRQKFAGDTKIQEWLATGLRPCRMTCEAIE